MSLLEELHKPDILDCIANLSSDEVFTPPKLVNQVLDILPQELFSNPDIKFLDPCCKTGVFLREIAKRLLVGLEDKIPNRQERIEHILKNQLFGIAITNLTSQVTRRTVYCSKDARNEKYKQFKFETKEGNIFFDENIGHFWFQNKCTACGASKEQWDREKGKESHAYNFIHCNERQNSKLFERLKNMKFDVIIGNPPYQLKDGGNSASAGPLYHLFVNQAKKLNPRYITMIIPARWFSGGKGLDSFRDEMLHDESIRIIHDFPAASDCFPGVPIEGGVCYFLWNRDNKGLCKVYTHKDSFVKSTMERPLLEQGCNTFIRYNESISILRKIQQFNEETMDKQISSRKPFGLATNFDDISEEKFVNAIKIYANGKVGYVRKSQLSKGLEYVNKYKIFISKAYGYGANAIFPHQIINKPFVVDKNTCCTETYLMVGPYENETIANNVLQYMKTLLFRFLVLLKKNTQDATKIVYSFVPIQDFNEEWTDEKLYKKYGLTEKEIAFIESMIRPME